LAERDPSIVSGELPVDRTIRFIPTLLPRSDIRSEGRCVVNPSIKTLSFEDANLDLGHVQPTPTLGRVVELEPTYKALEPPEGNPSTIFARRAK
jgi:hypothetical protein